MDFDSSNETERREMNEEERAHDGRSKVERYRWVTQDSPGEFKFIKKDLLRVNKEYQRELNEKKVLEIAGEWSWVGCGAIIVVRTKDGTYFVVDGQHRVSAALRRADIEELPCMVFRFDGTADQARAFLIANTLRRPLTAIEKFKAEVMTEDEIALLVNGLIDESGRRMSRESGPNTISCVRLLTKWARRDPSRLARLWGLINEVCDGEAMHSRLVDGLLLLDKRMPEGESLTEPRWRRRLKQVGYERLLEGVVAACAFYEKGGERVYAKGILRAINKGLHNKMVVDLGD